MKERLNKAFNICVLLILVLFLFYYSYRYVLQYNSVDTSPTYSDTPTIFKLMKYALLAILILLLVGTIIFKRIKIKLNTITILILLAFIDAVYIAFMIHSINAVVYLTFIFLIGIIYLLGSSVDEIKLDRLLTIYLYYTIIYEIIQLMLYAVNGRLPALAYNTGNFTDIRFGGALDDPNGFGVLLALFIPFTFNKYNGFKRWLLCIVLYMFLIITWSLTAIATVSGILVAYGVYRVYKKNKINKKTVTLFLGILIALIAGIILCLNSETIQTYITNKQGSIDDHLSGFEVIKTLGPFTILGIYPKEVITEAGIIRLIGFGGIIFTIIFYSIGIYTITILNKLIKNKPQYKHLYYGFMFYLAGFMVASLNLPMIDSFVNYGMYAIIVAISLVNYRLVENNKTETMD